MLFAFQLLKKYLKNTFGYVSKKKIDSFYTISDIETQMRFMRFFAFFFTETQFNFVRYAVLYAS
jgi:type IV secretory pathway component VirB8